MKSKNIFTLSTTLFVPRAFIHMTYPTLFIVDSFQVIKTDMGTI